MFVFIDDIVEFFYECIKVKECEMFVMVVIEFVGVCFGMEEFGIELF